MYKKITVSLMILIFPTYTHSMFGGKFEKTVRNIAPKISRHKDNLAHIVNMNKKKILKHANDDNVKKIVLSTTIIYKDNKFPDQTNSFTYKFEEK
jgi:hypothetical protein